MFLISFLQLYVVVVSPFICLFLFPPFVPVLLFALLSKTRNRVCTMTYAFTYVRFLFFLSMQACTIHVLTHTRSLFTLLILCFTHRL
ncbi:hypothetical protein BT96DRAFT_713419 [Gymnopus androsaceus JB14]|uniref:Uncharacterized protein n=1 Tax=Gymnopus androsaceus JB14 TaxID=1447944 RepID=A0A6A4HLF8_9AGAR|nr:hypothetical protein BT96DRAFT_713419 [Gymnopus androsaceus JB14]